MQQISSDHRSADQVIETADGPVLVRRRDAWTIIIPNSKRKKVHVVCPHHRKSTSETRTINCKDCKEVPDSLWLMLVMFDKQRPKIKGSKKAHSDWVEVKTMNSYERNRYRDA